MNAFKFTSEVQHYKSKSAHKHRGIIFENNFKSIIKFSPFKQQNLTEL